VDRQNVLSPGTVRAFAALNWSVQVAAADVFDWLGQPAPPADLMYANLFLHHFHDDRLRALAEAAATRTALFVACEPRRAAAALTASRLVGLIGCNSVTRHDAVVSVRAGFVTGELSRFWPAAAGWTLGDRPAGLFSQCFVARRHD